MATELWVELVCARCARSGPGRHVNGRTIPRRELVEDAKLYGWKFKDDDAYCNARCMEEHTND